MGQGLKISGPTEAQDTFFLNDRSKLGRSCRRTRAFASCVRSSHHPAQPLVIVRVGPGKGVEGAACLLIEEKSEAGVHS